MSSKGTSVLQPFFSTYDNVRDKDENNKGH